MNYKKSSKEKSFDHDALQQAIMNLKNKYPFLEINTIGKSVEGRDLYSLTFGVGKRSVIYNGAHHGNEWITSMLLMKWLEELCKIHYINHLEPLYKNVYFNNKLYFVPMINPDGVEIVIHGIEKRHQTYPHFLGMNSSNSLSNWKANINGIDLNRNYDAGFDQYKEIEYKLGIVKPCESGFSGKYPLSEPESAALAAFTFLKKPQRVYAFHSQGEVIYYQSPFVRLVESKEIALFLSKCSGYQLEDEPDASSYNGYKDWFIKEFRLPGFTIEVGKGVNPLPIKALGKIYHDIRELLFFSTRI